jgi:hypothetical protein
MLQKKPASEVRPTDNAEPQEDTLDKDGSVAL